MKSPNLLVLFTEAYPFDSLEPHLSDEVNYLFEHFENVYIFSGSVRRDHSVPIPSNVKAFRSPIHLGIINKIKSIRFLFSKDFLNERTFYKTNFSSVFSFRRIKIYLAEMSRAHLLFHAVKKELNSVFQKNIPVYFYSFWNNYKAITAALLKVEYPGSKAFSRAHGWDVYFERHTENYLPCKFFIFQKLDAVFHVSKNGMRYNIGIFGDLPNMKISLLGTKNNNLPVFNKSRKPFYLVSCSSIIPLKRLNLIIEALRVINIQQEIQWTHIGHGELAEDIKNLAKGKLSDKKNLTYIFTGQVQREEVKEFLSSQDVNLFINVSSTEGLPVSIMEAMSFGIPVVATDVGGTSEIVENGINGLLLNANPSPKEIAAAIEKYILMDDNNYLLQCKAADATWQNKFNAEKNYPAFIEEIFKL